MKRIQKLRSTLETKREGECSVKVPNTQDEPVDSREIVARMMRVSASYVSFAQRIQRDAPALFGRVRVGSVSLSQALRDLDGAVDDERSRRIRVARTRLNGLLRNAEKYPEFLVDLEAFLAKHVQG